MKDREQFIMEIPAGLSDSQKKYFFSVIDRELGYLMSPEVKVYPLQLKAVEPPASHPDCGRCKFERTCI